MKHTNLHAKFQELDNLEREELKKAVLAHGGEFSFQDENGDWRIDVDYPMVMASNRYWEENYDCVVTRVTVEDGHLNVYGCAKDYQEEESLLDFIEFGHVSFITDAIPETAEVCDVTTEPPVDKVDIVCLCRDDIEVAGFNPNIDDKKLQEVADRVSKYFEWQDLNFQFMENVRQACSFCNVPSLKEDKQ